jgi:outer membrane protein assembly factor BamB
MKKIVKTVLKIILGIVLILVLVVGFLVIRYWDSVEILRGTQDLAVPAQSIPPLAASTAALRDRGPADWPCWRGQMGDGHSTVQGIVKDWSDGLPQLWEVDYLCQGKASATWSAPVVQGDRLVVCGRDDVNDLVFCLNATDGSLLWHGGYPAQARNNHGTGPRATPAIDEDRVYTFGRGGDLVCWDLKSGTQQWHRKVEEEGGRPPTWGHASSPLVSGNRVLVQGGGTARVLAYDKLSGDVLWKSGNGSAGYAPLVATEWGDTPAFLAFHGDGLAAIAAGTGAELWNMPWKTSFGVNATTPLISGNRVFITSGYGTGGQLLTFGPAGAEVLWTNKVVAAHHTDGFVLDGFYYGYSGQSMQNKGSFKCMALADGTETWATRAMGWGTCVLVDGHLMCLDIKGNLFLMKPDPEKYIAVTSLPRALGDIKGPAWTLPVLANDRLYLRFKQRLVCYAIVAAAAAPPDVTP